MPPLQIGRSSGIEASAPLPSSPVTTSNVTTLNQSTLNQGEVRRQKDDGKTSKVEKPKSEENSKHSTKRCTDVSADVAKRRNNDGCKKSTSKSDDDRKGFILIFINHYFILQSILN